MLRLWGVMREDREVNQPIVSLLFVEFWYKSYFSFKVLCALFGHGTAVKVKRCSRRTCFSLLDGWYFKYLRMSSIITLKELQKLRVFVFN